MEEKERTRRIRALAQTIREQAAEMEASDPETAAHARQDAEALTDALADLRQKSEALEVIMRADQQPGHVNYRNKAEMARLAGASLNRTEVLRG